MSSIPKVAYFCMEYGLQSDFHTYAGGLGILAGDFLKEAKDQQVPMVAIGLKWKQGYVNQRLDEHNYPYDCYKTYDYDHLEETSIQVDVTIKDQQVTCKVWKATDFGNVPLYLLDTDVEGNQDKWITAQLYGGYTEQRIAQEIVLGIGGIRVLRQLGLEIDAYHFNEGHAVFAGLELIREKMCCGDSFEESWRTTKEEIVFTTHTPIEAGNESHAIDALCYMGMTSYLSQEQLIRIGGSPFNMTVAALKLSRKSNAVSELHAETANTMWKGVAGSSSIIPITNGVHPKTWVDDRMSAAYEAKQGIWNQHQELKQELIDYIADKTGASLSLDTLLLGCCRRMVPYKRNALIFHDLEVIDPLLKAGKFQIVFSGKAHPLDETGKKVIQHLVTIADKYPNQVVFLENYNMEIGHYMTRGVDVWLNSPRIPLEACGTSGMKAAMNGILNFSTLDGWWPEACEHGKNGWQFGDGYSTEKIKIVDQRDADSLYAVFNDEVIPTYYDKRDQWVEMMYASIESTRERFSTKVMMEKYIEELYQK
ncbi:alpha-glucan family phosphorylase [Longirhabdus pacifica]|uniref:alpha-glucan family phosphorylase n=1 Tax=Longirhabdus pacifica TaxID=2305227 RepID=UPI001008A54A|nr:alpha-glucan family phosphorylase [Longirhabdus pacifica]